MKKIKFLGLVLTILVCTLPIFVNAEEKITGRISSTTGLRMRKGPGVSYDKIITIPHNTRVQIVSYGDSGNGCDNKWAEVIYEATVSSHRGYVCSTYLEDIETVIVDTDNKNDENTKDDEEVPPTDVPSNSTMANMTDEEFNKYLTEQGFPDSYKEKLKALHKLHPTWIFKGIKSNYNWSDALREESANGTSLFNVNTNLKEQGYEGYLSTEPGNYNFETDTFYAHDGIYWFQANNDTIAYYMDPRNFLNETNIFMFEDLLYNPSYQDENAVNKILSSNFMKQFSKYFIESAEKYNVSPMYLAALSRQEVGLSDTNIVTNGKAGVLSDGVDYTGYYNFFNIGASSSGDPKLKSLQAAKANNWNTEQKSIVEGSYKITVNYIQCGQYTSYFQKFNLAPTATKGLWHQYTTNISALVSPAVSTYNSYNSMGIIDEDFTFSIPIFDGMPEKTSLPSLGNPNNYLSELKVNNISVSNFSGDNLNYDITIPYSDSVNITAKTVNGKATIEGIGEKEITKEVSTFEIKVIAQNKEVRIYKINVTREKLDEENMEANIKVNDVLESSGYKFDDYYIWNIPLSTNVSGMIKNLSTKYKTVSINIKTKNGSSKTDGTVVTGDKVIIEINGESKTLEVVIYGDTNGDGNISAIDLLNIQKHILGYTTLLGSYAKAGDLNRDSSISAWDLLQVQKYILGYTNISQG